MYFHHMNLIDNAPSFDFFLKKNYYLNLGGFEIWKEEADLMKLIINFKHIFHIVGHDKKIISKKCLPLKRRRDFFMWVHITVQCRF